MLNFMDNIYKKIIEKYKEKTAQKCCEITICENEIPQIMDDKIGGIPYFPQDETYPIDSAGNAMALLLQVNLEHVDIDGFPRNGILEIFTSTTLDWPLEYKVFIFDKNKLQMENMPQIDTENFVVPMAFKIKLKTSIAHMTVCDYRANDVIMQIAQEVTSKEDIAIRILDDEIYDNLDIDVPLACLGGYADFVQSDPRYKESNRDFCLFKLDSMLHNTINIGDNGILSVTISEEDLKNRNVNNAVLEWDCY